MKREYQALMEQIKMPPDCEEHISAALQQPPQKKRLVRTMAVAAAAVCLLAGSAMAVGYQTGVLDVFFPERSAVLESYVQYPDSVSNGDYRLSINGSLYDGNNFYAVIVVEGLNEQAVADLKSNHVIAQSHLDFWGQDMVDRLLASGKSGPDTFHLLNASGFATRELAPPDASSRSWYIYGSFFEAPGEAGSIGLWIDFIGQDYIVNIPIETVITPLTLYPEGSDCVELTVYATSVKAVFRSSEPSDDMLREFSIALKDGSVLTREDLGLWLSDGTNDFLTQRCERNYRFDIPIDPAQIAAVTINGVETAVP